MSFHSWMSGLRRCTLCSLHVQISHKVVKTTVKFYKNSGLEDYRLLSVSGRMLSYSCAAFYLELLPIPILHVSPSRWDWLVDSDRKYLSALIPFFVLNDWTLPRLRHKHNCYRLPSITNSEGNLFRILYKWSIVRSFLDSLQLPHLLHVTTSW